MTLKELPLLTLQDRLIQLNGEKERMQSQLNALNARMAFLSIELDSVQIEVDSRPLDNTN